MEYCNNVFIGIGSNLHNALNNCQRGITALKEKKEINIIQRSSFYKTEPVGELEQDWFINCVVKIKTSLCPENLLIFLQKLETIMGRTKSFTKWGPRVIDFDILFYDNKIIDTPYLIIPHPLNHKRRFVLEPMGEIAPDLMHPLLNKSIKELKKKITCLNQKVVLYTTNL